ncbi:MAG: ABC transporter permease [Pseudomonadales bacterium]
MSELHYQPDDFEALPENARQQQEIPPGLSYWAKVWLRFRVNPRSLLSLLTLTLLISMVLLGPLIWSQDPSQIWLESRLQDSQGGLVAVLVEPELWQPNIRPPVTVPARPIALLATTEQVRIQWAPLADVRHYWLYRHTRMPQDKDDVGLPLGYSDTPWYEDQLNLKSRLYVYTVVAEFTDDTQVALPVLEVTPQLAIGLSSARLQGLVAESAIVGDTVTLPAHPLGTDALGRDTLARLLLGGRTSLFIGLIAPLVAVFLGAIYGGIAGLTGGRTDEIMMRFADFIIALPFLLFMILLKVLLGIGPGENGIMPMLLALIILGWPASARLVRGQILQLRQQDYVNAALLLGANRRYLLGRHLLPNVMGVLLVALSFAIPQAIFAEAFLSFIGLGVTAPATSWGTLSNEGMRLILSHPQQLLFPAACISLTVLGFNLLGDGLRDALDIQMQEGPA